MNYKQRMKQIVSGAPAGDLTPIGNGYARDNMGRIYRIKSIEAIEESNKYGYMRRDKRHFTFSHMQEMIDATSKLSNKHAGHMLMLLPYIQYRTNILTTAGREGNQQPLNIDDLAKIFGIQRRYVKKIVDELIEVGAIEIVNGELFKVNERYHFRKRANKEDVNMLVKTFSTTLKKIKATPAELGVLYKLIPYIHYESNLICANPFELDARKVKFLNTSEIAEIVGMSRQKLTETLKKLTAAGAIVTIQRKSKLVPKLSEVKGDGRETVVLVNHNVITRKTGEHDVIAEQLFADLL